MNMNINMNMGEQLSRRKQYRNSQQQSRDSSRNISSSISRNLSSFDNESDNDRPKKNPMNKNSSSKSSNSNNKSNTNNNNNDYENIHDDDEFDDEDFLNFDEEALLKELMELSEDLNDLDDDGTSIDFDDEMEELERLIDEHSNMSNNTELGVLRGGVGGVLDDVREDGSKHDDDGNEGGSSNSKDNFDDYYGGISGISGRDEKIKSDGVASLMPEKAATSFPMSSPLSSSSPESSSSTSFLEEALLQGVVPATAGVGSNCLPGDYGFDPLGLSTKNYYKQVQNLLLRLLPSNNEDAEEDNIGGAALPLSTKPYNDLERPPALILRDYREAEIRHGRLAMLAAILWPLQEIVDRLFIPESFGQTTFVYGGTTLPFISLFMTLLMLLLGYLDIYAASIKDIESGDAFLPGECFWDPLRMLDGAPDLMKRKMQERELNNGRFAMVAVLSYIIQEAVTHQPVINLPWNQVLFEPAFEIPAVQAWLDGQFAGGSINSIGVDNFDVSIGETGDILDAFNEVVSGDNDQFTSIDLPDTVNDVEK
jgi:light-harvesting complex I chlorophyll a/b binding protein 1